MDPVTVRTKSTPPNERGFCPALSATSSSQPAAPTLSPASVSIVRYRLTLAL